MKQTIKEDVTLFLKNKYILDNKIQLQTQQKNTKQVSTPQHWSGTLYAQQ